MSEISSITLPRKPCLHVAVIGAFCVRDRQHEAGRPIEKAELEQIDAQERAGAVRDAAEHRNLTPGDRELLTAERGILINATDSVLQPRNRIMQQRLLEPRHTALAYHALVHHVVGEAALVAAE